MSDDSELLPPNAIRVEEVARILGKSVPAVWDNLAKWPDFPQPTRVPGRRLTYWLRDHVECFFTRQVDKAWRERDPHPAIFDPQLLDNARRAVYVLWLLCILPQDVPGGLGYTDDDNERVYNFAVEVVEGLERNKPNGPINSRGYLDVEVAKYHKTLAYCSRVLKHRTDPGDNGWFENRVGYRRGIYLRFGTTSGRKPWQEPQS